MQRRLTSEQRALEIGLILVCIGLACLFLALDSFRMAALNLFFLPVGLTGFFLGRYRAGVMALFCFLITSVVAALNLTELTVNASPMVTVLVVVVWGAALGMNALLVGTLSDEQIKKSQEIHEAYVGVVE